MSANPDNLSILDKIYVAVAALEDLGKDIVSRVESDATESVDGSEFEVVDAEVSGSESTTSRSYDVDHKFKICELVDVPTAVIFKEGGTCLNGSPATTNIDSDDVSFLKKSEYCSAIVVSFAAYRGSDIVVQIMGEKVSCKYSVPKSTLRRPIPVDDETTWEAGHAFYSGTHVDVACAAKTRPAVILSTTCNKAAVQYLGSDEPSIYVPVSVLRRPSDIIRNFEPYSKFISQAESRDRILEMKQGDKVQAFVKGSWITTLYTGSGSDEYTGPGTYHYCYDETNGAIRSISDVHAWWKIVPVDLERGNSTDTLRVYDERGSYDVDHEFKIGELVDVPTAVIFAEGGLNFDGTPYNHAEMDAEYVSFLKKSEYCSATVVAHVRYGNIVIHLTGTKEILKYIVPKITLRIPVPVKADIARGISTNEANPVDEATVWEGDHKFNAGDHVDVVIGDSLSRTIKAAVIMSTDGDDNVTVQRLGDHNRLFYVPVSALRRPTVDIRKMAPYSKFISKAASCGLLLKLKDGDDLHVLLSNCWVARKYIGTGFQDGSDDLSHFFIVDKTVHSIPDVHAWWKMSPAN